MKTLKKLLSSSYKLEDQINSLNELSGYLYCDDLSMMDIDYTDPDEVMLLNELRGIMEKLNDIKSDLLYLQRPVKAHGKLRLNNNGRYELKGHEFHCGDRIEVKIYDERWEWCVTRIEHDGDGFYLVGHRDVSLNGISARIRCEETQW